MGEAARVSGQGTMRKEARNRKVGSTSITS